MLTLAPGGGQFCSLTIQGAGLRGLVHPWPLVTHGHPNGIAWGKVFRCRGGVWVPLNSLREERSTSWKWVGPGGVSRSLTQHPCLTQPVWGGQGQCGGQVWAKEEREEGACVYADSPSRNRLLLGGRKTENQPRPGQPQKLPKSGRASGLTGRGQAAPQGMG